MNNLRRRALVSLAASYISQFAQTGANFAIKILLARLIAPAQWGVYAEAMMVVLVADTLTDVGLSQHVVREKHRPYGNVLLIRLFLSIFWIGVILALSPLLAPVFKTQEIVGAARGLAPLVFVRALMSVPRIFLDRELMIHKALLPQFVGVALMGAVSLPLAYAGYGVWALIIGTIIGETAQASLLWIAARKTIHLELTLSHTRTLLYGSRYLFLIAVIGFVLQQGHVAITGSLLSPKQVGFFAMAYTLITLVSQVVETAIYRVIYPMFCEYSSDIPKLGRIYKCATIVMLSIEAPIAFFLLFNSSFFVNLLLSHKWMPMAPILAALAPTQIINKYSTFGMEVLRATKRDRWLMAIYVASAIALTFFGVLLTRMYGVYGMVAAYYIAIGAVLMIVSLSRIIRDDLIDLTWKMAVVYTVSFILAAIPALLLGILGLTARLAAIAAVLLSWALFFKLYWHSVAKPTLKDME